MTERRLGKWLSKAQKLVIVGIGNPLRMDDYVGMRIVEDLRGRLPRHVLLIESETVPEAFLQQIIDFNPSHVLLIDAAAIGEKPGTSKALEYSELPDFSPISTHALPLRIFCQYLSENLNAAILLLLVEPKNTDFGEGLSAEVATSTRRLERILMDSLSETGKG